MELSEYIKELRLKKKLTMRELGKIANINYSSISKIESGSIAKPEPLTLKAIAEPLGVDYLDLYVMAGYIDDKVNMFKKGYEDGFKAGYDKVTEKVIIMTEL